MSGQSLTFVSDAGRPGTCQGVGCGHGEFDHELDGPCRVCSNERRDQRDRLKGPCERYDPVRFFQDGGEE